MKPWRKRLPTVRLAPHKQSSRTAGDGFLLDETDEAVEIRMELTEDAEVRPGRWRLHIPRVSIQEIRIIHLGRLLPKRRKTVAARAKLDVTRFDLKTFRSTYATRMLPPWSEQSKCHMPDLKQEEVERYLQSVLGAQVAVTGMSVLGGDRERKDVKGFGYGVPLRVDILVDGHERTLVLHTLTPGPFGHEHLADRARALLWDHQAFNCLPRHVRSLDVCGFHPGGHLSSVGNVEEFGLLTEYADGESYSHDLERLRDTGEFTERDLARADALCDYLVEIHKTPGSQPGLYVRRIRELVGDGECIMGIADSYAQHPLVPASLLETIEQLCVSWRWRLKGLTHRLHQVHGDFHPWNILFRSEVDFWLLDRSRGEYGDPADDVTSLTLNYVFFSLQRSGRLEGGLETLFHRFWERYLERSGDLEILRVAAPFFAFRGLVMASPVWYPTLPNAVRQRILGLVIAVLESRSFDPQEVNRYCGA